LLILATLVPSTLAACGGDDNDEDGATGPGSDEPTGAVARTSTGDEKSAARGSRGASRSARRTRKPSISIVAPTDDETVTGSAVTVTVSVKGFEVVTQRVRPPFPPPVAGKGHVHFYLDTRMLPRTHAPPATGTYRSISAKTYTWTGVGPGRHTFAAQLVGKDHVPLGAPVKDRVSVTVE
jgi:hypothetical protein